MNARLIIDGKFLVAKNTLRLFTHITLEWPFGEPTFVRAIGCSWVRPGHTDIVQCENDDLLERLNAWNDFVPYAIQYENDIKEAKQERADVRYTYYSDFVRSWR